MTLQYFATEYKEDFSLPDAIKIIEKFKAEISETPKEEL